MISNHGQLKVKHSHFLVGRNSRLDTLQASVLEVKLRYLDKWNKDRRLAASNYISKLKECDGIVIPEKIPHNKHVFHLFVIQCNRRKELIKLFNSTMFHLEFITRKQYPFSMHIYIKTIQKVSFRLSHA